MEENYKNINDILKNIDNEYTENLDLYYNDCKIYE